MAQQVRTILISDISGEEISDGAGQTIEFSVRGVDYRIDLTDAEVSDFDQAIQLYIRHGERVGGRRRVAGGTAPARTDKAQLDAMRRWARAHGYQVSDRGRIAASIQEAYHAASQG